MTEDNPLEPAIKRRDLPAEVIESRTQASAEYGRFEAMLRPRVEAHVATYGMALDVLTMLHQELADTLDFDITGDTRQPAVWQMAGRCIGLARALLYLVRAGFCAESIPTARALHEADRLLDAFADPDEDELLLQWLRDTNWIPPRDARKARGRIEEKLDEAMSDAGMPPLRGTVDLSGDLYGRLSGAGHHRRPFVAEAVSVPLRQMATGPHPDPIHRATYVEWAGHVIEEAVQTVGDAFVRFYGPAFFNKQVGPLVSSFKAIREAQNLGPDVLGTIR